MFYRICPNRIIWYHALLETLCKNQPVCKIDNRRRLSKILENKLLRKKSGLSDAVRWLLRDTPGICCQNWESCSAHISTWPELPPTIGLLEPGRERPWAIWIRIPVVDVIKYLRPLVTTYATSSDVTYEHNYAARWRCCHNLWSKVFYNIDFTPLPVV